MALVTMVKAAGLVGEKHYLELAVMVYPTNVPIMLDSMVEINITLEDISMVIGHLADNTSQ